MILSAFGADDPGSNPGGPIEITVITLIPIITPAGLNRMNAYV